MKQLTYELKLQVNKIKFLQGIMSGSIKLFNTNDNKLKISKSTEELVAQLEKLGFENWNDIGAKIICKTNKLLDQNIFNNKEFIIHKLGIIYRPGNYYQYPITEKIE